MNSYEISNPDKMEAAAAGISAHRSSTGGTNTTASSDSQNATSAASKTSGTGSETGQTSTAAASTTITGTAAVSSQASGMLIRLYRQQVNDSGEPFSPLFSFKGRKTWCLSTRFSRATCLQNRLRARQGY